jgi:CheY-like chemotaxis protein
MKKILFVDDDPSMHKMVDLFLRNSDYELSWAKNGRSALKMMKDMNFDVIISDIQMPEMDGLTFLTELRKKNKKTPFIILTAFGQDKMSEKAIKSGASAVINKPFESKKLQSLISELTA